MIGKKRFRYFYISSPPPPLQRCPICCERFNTPSSYYQPTPSADASKEDHTAHKNIHENHYNTSSALYCSYAKGGAASRVVRLKKCGHLSHWWCLRAMVLNQQVSLTWWLLLKNNVYCCFITYM